MHGYVCIFYGKTFEVYASGMYEAKQKAIAHFRPRRAQEHMISVCLAEKNGETVLQSTAI